VVAVVAASTGLPRRTEASPDLAIHPAAAPAKLKMRTAAREKPPVATVDAAAPAAPELTAFTALPRSTRELAERITFRLRAGVELDSAPASGDLLRGGTALPPGFAESRPWIVGDAMVGARDLLLPSLGGYFLSSFQFDASDSPASRTALVTPGDATDQRIAIKAGYAEWGNDDRHPESVWLRGGRQFRLDGGAMFAYFDGLTAGYRTPGLEISAFAGQRVVLYVDSPAGVTFGATAAVDLAALRGVPVRVAVDYLGLSIQPGGDADRQLRQLVSLTGSYEPSNRLRADLRARFIDGGSDRGGASLVLGRVGGRFKLNATERAMVVVDVEQRQGGDLAYDLAAPSAVDVVDVARKLGVGLGAPIDALTVGGRVDLRGKASELLVFGRAELPEQTPIAVDQEGWFEGGAALAGQPLGSLWITAQYTGRKYTRQRDANIMGSAFDDTAGSGLDRLHELSLDATLRSQARAGTRWRASLGGFYRIYDLVTPYRTAADDGRGGGRLELQLWLTKAVHVEAAAEVAQASPILAREIGAMSSVRGALEARW
jgi:hypothetical protein